MKLKKSSSYYKKESTILFIISTSSIPYLRFTKIIIGHYMTNFPKISRRARDKYHNLKDDDIMKNIFNSWRYKEKVRMKIPAWMITEEMKHTEHYRMYVEVFGIDVPLTQSHPTNSTQGTARFMPRKSFAILADHLHEAMVESLPTMVDKHVKEQVQKQVPEQTTCITSVVRPRDQEDPHDDAHPKEENSAKRRKTSNKKEKRVMRHSEIHKFCDATLNRVLEGLKCYNNDVKYGYIQKDLTKDEAEYLKLFEEEIELRLNYRGQMRRWEMYVNGRPLGRRRERPE
uniref:Uncharacterized protein n=1 Tax=Tanacetum cinerariifolium TaxID=118510 RepID=A0A699KNU8_TANCI|nr:hypothetical protein [Tanacetum cinerariifolium]